MTLGNQLTETWTFDPMRLQPQEIKTGPVLDLKYYYCPNSGTTCGSNNGNVLSAAIDSTGAVSGTAHGVSVTQTYQYTGGLNRLTAASEGTAWSQTYNYDAFGNRAVTGTQNGQAWVEDPVGNATDLSQFDGANRLKRDQGTNSGDQYDGAGNQTAVASSAMAPDVVANTMTYDAENRMVTANIANTGTVTYLYDGEGRRVQKTVGSAVTTYVYNAAGELAEEFSTAPPAGAGTEFLSGDALGSTRMVTDGSGMAVRLYDYYPFGGDVAKGVNGRGTLYATGGYPGQPDVEPVKFTGKERDAETGLDYFGARYFSGAQGRFTSPDPKMFPHDLTDPQSWNKYGYTRNNPLRYVDPDGEDWQDALKGGLNAFFSDNAFGAGRISSGNSDFRTGQSIGDAVATVQGTVETLAGIGGEIGGTVLDATGIGALIGVPAQVVSAGAIIQGSGTAAIAGSHLANAAFSSSTNDPPVNTLGGGQIGEPNGPKAGSSGGPGAGRKATAQERAQALKENNGNCVFCGNPANEADHADPKSRGGNNTTGPNGNLQPTCTNRNRGPGGKHAQTTEEFLRRKQEQNQ